jgi:hypothetical protein
MVDILVRGVTPETHKELKLEAIRQGTTLSEVARRRLESPAGQAFTATSLDAFRRKRAALQALDHVDWSDQSWRASHELDARDDDRLVDPT